MTNHLVAIEEIVRSCSGVLVRKYLVILSSRIVFVS